MLLRIKLQYFKTLSVASFFFSLVKAETQNFLMSKAENEKPVSIKFSVEIHDLGITGLFIYGMKVGSRLWASDSNHRPHRYQNLFNHKDASNETPAAQNK